MQVKHILYHTSFKKEGVIMFYVTVGSTILGLEAKIPNEPEWRHHCSCPFHSHLIFYSFIQPQSPNIALILVLFKKKNKSTHFFPVKDENVYLSLLCASSLTLVKFGCRKPLRAHYLCETLNISRILQGTDLHYEDKLVG